MYVRVVYTRWINAGLMGVCLSVCKPSVRIKVPFVVIWLLLILYSIKYPVDISVLQPKLF